MPRSSKISTIPTHDIFLAVKNTDDVPKAAEILGCSPAVLKAEFTRRNTSYAELSGFTIKDAESKFGKQFYLAYERKPLAKRTAEEVYTTIKQAPSKYKAALSLDSDGATLQFRLDAIGVSFYDIKNDKVTEEDFCEKYRLAYPETPKLSLDSEFDESFWEKSLSTNTLETADPIPETVASEEIANKPKKSRKNPNGYCLKKLPNDYRGFWEEHAEKAKRLKATETVSNTEEVNTSKTLTFTPSENS